VPASHASPGKVMATHIGMERMSALASVPTKPADSLKDQNSSNRKVPMIFGPAFIAVHRSRKPATDDGAPGEVVARTTASLPRSFRPATPPATSKLF